MQSVGRRYVQYINRFYRRTGSLWEGRYKSSLVQAETHLLACLRYIELNPVRAGMVRDPSQYRWSSYRANGLGYPDPRLKAHPLYPSLGPTPMRPPRSAKPCDWACPSAVTALPKRSAHGWGFAATAGSAAGRCKTHR